MGITVTSTALSELAYKTATELLKRKIECKGEKIKI